MNSDMESKEIHEGFDISRTIEWEKWFELVAGRPIRGKRLRELLNDGHIPIPTRWADTGRNAYLRFPGGPLVLPDFKSRSCARSDIDGIDGLRKDGPTAECEGYNLLFSFASLAKF